MRGGSRLNKKDKGHTSIDPVVLPNCEFNMTTPADAACHPCQDWVCLQAMSLPEAALSPVSPWQGEQLIAAHLGMSWCFLGIISEEREHYSRSGFNCPRMEFSPRHMVLKTWKGIVTEGPATESHSHTRGCNPNPSKWDKHFPETALCPFSRVKTAVGFVFMLLKRHSYFDESQWESYKTEIRVQKERWAVNQLSLRKFCDSKDLGVFIRAFIKSSYVLRWKGQTLVRVSRSKQTIIKSKFIIKSKLLLKKQPLDWAISIKSAKNL